MPTSSVFSITSKQKSVPDGGGGSRLKLTEMAAVSATGEKLPMFVIWKSQNPRCFKNITHLPCEYKSQKKSWMNSEIFEE